MKVSVCSDMLFWGKDFDIAAESIMNAGADAIEFWQWPGKDFKKISQTVKERNIKMLGFCADCEDKDLATQMFRHALNSEDKELLIKALKESIPKAKEIGAKNLIVTVGDSIDGLSYDQQINNVKDALNYAKSYLEENDVVLLIEPINPTERKLYLESRALPVINIIKEVGSPNIKLLYDIYHQAATGDLSVDEIVENIDYIGHIHIADFPGRKEPGTGSVDFDSILKAVKAAGYNGYLGIECGVLGSLGQVIQQLKNI